MKMVLYVSHPPFAYYFPFYIYKILHYRPDVTSLQIINYFLHFLAAIFVYFNVCLLSFNRARSHLHIPSFIAFCFYVFAPPTLWFQGNVYMSDMAMWNRPTSTGEDTLLYNVGTGYSLKQAISMSNGEIERLRLLGLVR
jgi:hypothetical protein